MKGASENIPVLLLVGGLGTRLQAVLPSTPKPLARIGDAPFLQLLLRQLSTQGFRRLIFCTGHLAEQIEKEFGDGRKWSLSIEYSREDRPLGTAGAVKLAQSQLADTAEFLVLNGDSFLELDFHELLTFHREHGAMVSIAVREVPDAARFGTVEIEQKNRVARFKEKVGLPVPGIINGGVYAFRRSALDHIPDGAASLEKDVFPRLLEHGVYALIERGMFIDIGTPEDYVRAQELSRSLVEAANKA